MTDNVRNIGDYRQATGNPAGRRNLSSGGGGGTFDGMEARVAQLEEKFDKIDAKLDRIADDVSETKGRVSALPAAKEFSDISSRLGRVEGRIDRLPTFAKLAALAAVLTTVVALMPRIWDWVSRLPL